MKIKILFLIVFSGLVFSISYSSTNNIITKAEVTYYENNKWDFIENEIVSKLNSFSEKNDLGLKIVGFLNVAMVLGWLGSEIFIEDDNFDPIRYIFRIYVPLMSIGYLGVLLSDNESEKENLSKILDRFFENYSIEQKSDLKVNYRKFIPCELLSTFDEIYASYKKEGVDSLKSYFNIFEMIRKKFVVPVKVK
ncbi:MAG: hypothetical protein ABIF12_00180 [bacterium]